MTDKIAIGILRHRMLGRTYKEIAEIYAMSDTPIKNVCKGKWTSENEVVKALQSELAKLDKHRNTLPLTKQQTKQALILVAQGHSLRSVARALNAHKTQIRDICALKPVEAAKRLAADFGLDASGNPLDTNRIDDNAVDADKITLIGRVLNMRITGCSYLEIADRMNLDYGAVRDACMGKTWNHEGVPESIRTLQKRAMAIKRGGRVVGST